MAVITMKELLEAGCHFGHQTKRWNPKMKRYIFGSRNGIHIIDLQQTLAKLQDACDFTRDICREGGSILFVGTKRQAQETVRMQAERCGMYFVNQRWLGGTLTNFQTIRKSTQKLKQLEEAMQDGTYDSLTKKELLKLERQREKLEKYFGGIKNMDKLPDAVFVVDTRKESIALNESRKTGVHAIAIVDTNCQPDGIDFIIPGNDDAIRAIYLMTSKLADAALEGAAESEAQMDEELSEQQQSDLEAQPPAQESDTDEVVKVEGQ